MLLGFLDDLFDIRWRHKLPIPIIAAVPTLLVYYAVEGATEVVLPGILGSWLAPTGLGWQGSKVVDLGAYSLNLTAKQNREADVSRATVLHLPSDATNLHNQLDQHPSRRQRS